MAEFHPDPQRVHEVLSNTRFIADPSFREGLRLQLRETFTARQRMHPFLGRMRAWIFSYPNGYHAHEEQDETMNKSKLLTAFSVSVLVLALAAFVGLVIVLPSLESSGDMPREASDATQNPLSEGSSQTPTDGDGALFAWQAVVSPDTPEPVTRTPITAGNVDQLVELAVLGPLSSSGAAIAFYPPSSALFISSHVDAGMNNEGWVGTLVFDTNTLQEVSRPSFVDNLIFSQTGRRLGDWSSPGPGLRYNKIYLYPSFNESGPSQIKWPIVLTGHRERVQAATFNTAGTRVASGSSGSTDNSLRIWDAQTGEQLLLVEFRTGVYSVAYSPDDALVAAGLGTGEIHLLDAESGDEIAVFEHTSPSYHLVFSPDGRLLASASRGSAIRLWDIQSLSLSRTLEGHVGQITDLAFNRDGSLLASSSKDATVRLWDPATGEILWQSGDSKPSATSAEWVVAFDFSPDGGLLAFLTGEGVGYVWGLPSGD